MKIQEEVARAVFGKYVTPYLPYFDILEEQYGVKTREDWCFFLAHVGIETGYFKSMKESMYYSEARLVAVWPSRYGYRKGKRNPKPFAKNPAHLANTTYSNRMGNGNYASGDGFKYIGRGMKMITGRGMYEEVQKHLVKIFPDIDIVAHPEEVERPEIAAHSAGYFWQSRNMGKYANSNYLKFPKDSKYTYFRASTKVLNGGYTQLKERFDLYQTLRNEWIKRI